MSMLVPAKLRQEHLVVSLKRHEGTQPSQLVFSCGLATHINAPMYPARQLVQMSTTQSHTKWMAFNAKKSWWTPI
jgi:hypothetical protein